MDANSFKTAVAVAMLILAILGTATGQQDKRPPATGTASFAPPTAPTATMSGVFEFYTMFVSDRDPASGKWTAPVYSVTIFRYDPAAQTLTLCNGHGQQDPWKVKRFADDGKTTYIETEDDKWTVTGGSGRTRVSRTSNTGRIRDADYTSAPEQ